MRQRKNYIMILAIAIAAIAGVAVAYAAMSQVLNVTTNKVTQTAVSGSIGFDTTGSPISATLGGTSSTGRSCGTATVTATSVTVADTTLSKPDDSCTYALSIKNTYGFAWKLSSLVPTKPTDSGMNCATVQSASTTVGAEMVCGNITYKITTDAAGTTPLLTNTNLAATTGTQPVYLIVKYTGESVNSSAVTQTGAKFTFTYAQN